ncbi:MAG: type II toxin-antitoxin system YafQ family toxin [bacterium]|nr:type II toxin-antitoxin system YafQ family toxin [bacterium]
MYGIILSRRYKISYKRLRRHKDFSQERLDRVITTLKDDTPLPAIYYDHALQGLFEGYRECHIQNDVLLLYQKDKEKLILILVEIGTHSSLFKK